MRYSASEKREIIKLVEQSSLPVGQTLKRLDINKSTFYNWLGRYRCGGDEALSDKHPGPSLPQTTRVQANGSGGSGPVGTGIVTAGTGGQIHG